MSVKWSGRGDGGSSAFSAAPFSVMSPTIQHSDKSPNLIKALSSDGLRTDFRLSGKAIISEPINYQCKFERCCARMIAFLLMIEVPRPIRSRRSTYAVRQLDPQPIGKRPYGPCSSCKCRLLPAMERLRSCWGGLPAAAPPKRNSPDLGDRPGPLPGCEAWGPELTPSQLHGVLLFL